VTTDCIRDFNRSDDSPERIDLMNEAILRTVFRKLPKLRQLVAVLPWGHNLLLLNKVNEDEHIEKRQVGRKPGRMMPAVPVG
jgi:hypothetical protein